MSEAKTSFQSMGATDRIDGVLCFGGEDWWYHNRGHYDMQMMRELSQRLPVLYVNSIGMRMPRLGEGRVFVRRIFRKLRSLSRGVRRVRDNFAVFSPVTLPRMHGTALANRSLAAQVRRAARRVGMTSPLVWVACPPAASVLPLLGSPAVAYQRTDRYESFPGVDGEFIRTCDRALKAAARVTFFCSSLLFEEEGPDCQRAAFVDHGVDYDRFAAAGDARGEPRDVRNIPRPRVGFVGGIDAHTFDPPLFLEVAGGLPDVSFVMVGGCSLPDGWCSLPNVYFLGQKPYEEVAEYMAACDVLLMPWNTNSWIQACNPVKLKEYLSVGRPVVSTPFFELRRFTSVVREASGSPAFREAIRDALKESPTPDEMRALVRDHTWACKGEEVVAALQGAGVEIPGARGSRSIRSGTV